MVDISWTGAALDMVLSLPEHAQREITTVLTGLNNGRIDPADRVEADGGFRYDYVEVTAKDTEYVVLMRPIPPDAPDKFEIRAAGRADGCFVG